MSQAIKGIQPVSAIICGQVRIESALKLNLDGLLKLKSFGLVDQIVISTWEGELSSLPPETLRQVDHVVETPRLASNPFGQATYPYQVVQIAGALEAVTGSGYVLKLRPDAYLNWGKVAELIMGIDAWPAPDDGRPLFESRIWTPYAHAAFPFGLCDVVYLGKKHDLLKVLNFNMYENLMGTRIFDREKFDEYRFWSDWFARVFPIFGEFRRVLSRMTWETYRTQYRSLLENDLHWDYISSYLMLIKRYFLIGRPAYEGHVGIIRRVDLKEDGTIEKLEGNNQMLHTIDDTCFLKNYDVSHPDYICFSSQTWINNIFNGSIDEAFLRETVIPKGRLLDDYVFDTDRERKLNAFLQGLK